MSRMKRKMMKEKEKADPNGGIPENELQYDRPCYRCRWLKCTTMYSNEDRMRAHIKEHFDGDDVRRCRWNSCNCGCPTTKTAKVPSNRDVDSHIDGYAIKTKMFSTVTCGPECCAQLFDSRFDLQSHNCAVASASVEGPRPKRQRAQASTKFSSMEYEVMQRTKMQSAREEREQKQLERLAALEEVVASKAAKVKATQDEAVAAAGVAVGGVKSHLPPQLEDCTCPVTIDTDLFPDRDSAARRKPVCFFCKGRGEGANQPAAQRTASCVRCGNSFCRNCIRPTMYALRRGWECPGCVRLTQPAEAVASDPGLPSAAVATKTTPKKKAASMKSRSTEETGFNLLNVCYKEFIITEDPRDKFIRINPVSCPGMTSWQFGEHWGVFNPG